MRQVSALKVPPTAETLVSVRGQQEAGFWLSGGRGCRHQAEHLLVMLHSSLGGWRWGRGLATHSSLQSPKLKARYSEVFQKQVWGLGEAAG